MINITHGVNTTISQEASIKQIEEIVGDDESFMVPLCELLYLVIFPTLHMRSLNLDY